MSNAERSPLLFPPVPQDSHPARQLLRDATPNELIQAAAENHTQWFQANALAAGGETRREDGLTAIYSPAANPDAPGEVILAFPQMNGENAGASIDAALAFAKSQNVGKLSCWSDAPTEPDDLGARLVARGFQWGWEPHWMALDLLAPPPADVPVPDGLHIAVDDANDWEVQDLPYYDRADALRWHTLARQTPRRTYHLGAWLNGEIVGHSLIYLSDGPLGVAGMYSVGVVPGARRQGIGQAVSIAACHVARSMGCRYVLLNAATHIYEKLGFVSLGYGQTWWMYPRAIDRLPVLPETVAFTEAVGRGDTNALDRLPQSAFPTDLDAPLVCRMTPLEVAAQLTQPASAEWLIHRGATPEIIPLWDLGWRDRVAELLDARPDLANRRLGEWDCTPLHEAAARNDVELARLVLSANPDLSIKDMQFDGTPLGWARHMQRQEIVALIEAREKGAQ